MGKVIVIDDEPFIRMLIEDKLKRAGLEVVTLHETVEAMDIIRREMPDLVILDWMMPELSGIDLCRMLKAEADLKHIPIFMLTAKGQEEYEKMGIECGVAQYISKPFSPKALLDMVIEQLGKEA